MGGPIPPFFFFLDMGPMPVPRVNSLEVFNDFMFSLTIGDRARARSRNRKGRDESLRLRGIAVTPAILL